MDEMAKRALFGQEVAKLVGGPLDGELRVIQDDLLPDTLMFPALEGNAIGPIDGPPPPISIDILHHVYRRDRHRFDKILQTHTYTYVPPKPS